MKFNKRIYIKGRFKVFFNSIVLKKKLKKYFKDIKTNPPKKVIYSCSTGEYDYINVDMYLNPKYKYVLFTDVKRDINKKYIGPWEIRPLFFDELDNQKNNRYHKFFPNEIFPEYEESIYVDTNVLVKTNKLFEKADSLENKKDIFIAIPPHRRRKCLYDEIEICLEKELDSEEKLQEHKEFLMKEGFPKNMGLTENNVIYRKHNNLQSINLMTQWWEMIDRYSKRDQLSLFYLLWKNKLEMTYLSDIAIKDDKDNFQINHHNTYFLKKKKKKKKINK